MKKDSQHDLDITNFMTQIQQQLSLLDRKVDALMNRTIHPSAPIRPESKPFLQKPIHTPVQNQGNARSNDHRSGRFMHRAMCADCKKECELPFKPSGDRPVYCQDCFSKRKSANPFKPAQNVQPQVKAQAPQAVISPLPEMTQAPTPEKKKSAAAQKSNTKKKVTTKKKAKKSNNPLI